MRPYQVAPLRRSSRLKRKGKEDDDEENEDLEPYKKPESKSKPKAAVKTKTPSKFSEPKGNKPSFKIDLLKGRWVDVAKNVPLSELMLYRK